MAEEYDLMTILNEISQLRYQQANVCDLWDLTQRQRSLYKELELLLYGSSPRIDFLEMREEYSLDVTLSSFSP